MYKTHTKVLNWPQILFFSFLPTIKHTINYKQNNNIIYEARKERFLKFIPSNYQEIYMMVKKPIKTPKQQPKIPPTL